MFRLVLFAVTFITSFATTGAIAGLLPTSESPAALCHIKYKTSNNKTINCSGVLVSDRIVATAAHCITDDIDRRIGGISVTCGTGTTSFQESFWAFGYSVNPSWYSFWYHHDTGSDFAFLSLDKRATTIEPMMVANSSSSMWSSFLYPSPTSAGSYELRPDIECRFSRHGYDEKNDVLTLRTSDRSPKTTGIKGFVSSNLYQLSALVINQWLDTPDVVRTNESGGAFYCRRGPGSPWILFGLLCGKWLVPNSYEDTGVRVMSLAISDQFLQQLRSFQKTLEHHESRKSLSLETSKQLAP